MDELEEKIKQIENAVLSIRKDIGNILVLLKEHDHGGSDGTKGLLLEDLNLIIQGNGSPENVVTASVGHMYLRRDGGTTSAFYVKETGTTASGWVSK